MTEVCSFAPISRADARVLVLGSMPGVASLAAGQYYAHGRNSFWPIMGTLFGFDPALPYLRRVSALQAARVAVWDVLQSCTRPGSLDSAIERNSEVANDFPAFFCRHPEIADVFFNGGAAEAAFRRHVLPALQGRSLMMTRLPSTSPANASFSFERKLVAWQSLLLPLSSSR
ncbi:MAG: DNA-deoxyinosine glycosylase [Rhodocyclaceae bacterium]